MNEKVYRWIILILVLGCIAAWIFGGRSARQLSIVGEEATRLAGVIDQHGTELKGITDRNKYLEDRNLLLEKRYRDLADSLPGFIDGLGNVETGLGGVESEIDGTRKQLRDNIDGLSEFAEEIREAIEAAQGLSDSNDSTGIDDSTGDTNYSVDGSS